MKDVHPEVWAAVPGNVRTKEDGVLKVNIFAKKKSTNVNTALNKGDQQQESKLHEEERASQKKKQKADRLLIMEQGQV